MDLKAFIIFTLTITASRCEFDVSSLINSTQQLQNIERGGGVINGLYPQLNLADNSINNNANGADDDNKLDLDSRAGGSRPFYLGTLLHSSTTPSSPTSANNRDRPFYLGTLAPPTMSVFSNEKFLNKTQANMPSGVCTKEVPTVSLLRPNELPVAGNGSNPTLSRIQVCCNGYQRHPHILRKCVPICLKGCVNGICIAPETCACLPEFTLNFNDQCVPVCPRGCENGVCNSDNTCRCNEGFVPSENGKFCTVACGAGFRAVGGICKPMCSKGCENGICTQPEKCECQRFGWVLDSSGSKCIPKCDKACLNGVCSGPNQCTCNNGYTHDIIDPSRCNPICNPICENSVCSGPNMCLCYQGYVKDRNVKSRCVKI